MKDVKSMALKHLIEKLVAMPPAKAEMGAEEAQPEHGDMLSPFTGEHDEDSLEKPALHVAEIEVLKKPKGK